MSKSVKEMFDGIAGKYDFLNHFLSLGRDISWRKKAAQVLDSKTQKNILDLCGGTGDFLHALIPFNINLNTSVIGDFSFNMLSKARQKFSNYHTCQLDALAIPFKPESFDVVTCGYGMRNLDDLNDGIKSVHNILAPGGTFITLEFFKPDNFITKSFYYGLAPILIPIMGGLFSGKSSAYKYLVDSVVGFYSVVKYKELLEKAGFSEVHIYPCDFGISHIVVAKKIN